MTCLMQMVWFYPGNVRVADLNGDNKIDANNDMQIIGWTRLRWVLGDQYS